MYSALERDKRLAERENEWSMLQRGWAEVAEVTQNWDIEGRTVVFPEGYDPENVPGVSHEYPYVGEYPFAGIGSERARELLELNFKRGRKWTVPLEEVAGKLGKRRQTVAEWIKDLGGLPKKKADRLCRAFLLDDAVHLLTGVSGKERANRASGEKLERLWREVTQQQEDKNELKRLMAFASTYEALPPHYRAALEDAARGYALLVSDGDPDRLARMGERGLRRACELVAEGWEHPEGGGEWFASYVKEQSFLCVPWRRDVVTLTQEPLWS